MSRPESMFGHTFHASARNHRLALCERLYSWRHASEIWIRGPSWRSSRAERAAVMIHVVALHVGLSRWRRI